MHVRSRNINTAFRKLVEGVHEGAIDTVPTTSRYGTVRMVPDPVIVTFERPLERVLHSFARDCNPFFHVYEALWMLAGRNDVAPLTFYNSRMPEFSDDGVTFNGAYGYRWRTALGSHVQDKYVDQLKLIVEHLRAKPDSRRVVLQMWNVEDDLLKIDTSKDVCCNTNVYFAIRREVRVGDIAVDTPVLDMTVCNRSNDMVWGMLGANVVHFSFLQEYLAHQLGVAVGRYHQMTNNLHVYDKTWEPTKLLAEYGPDWKDLYTEEAVWPVPLVRHPAVFDEELPRFVELYKDDTQLNGQDVWQEPFLQLVARPMLNAFIMFKHNDESACHEWLRQLRATDWRAAAAPWLARRFKARRAKSAAVSAD